MTHRAVGNAAALVVVARSNFSLFRTPDGEAFVTVDGDSFLLKSQEFADRLARLFRREHGSVPMRQALSDAIAILRADAADEAEQPLHIRVADTGANQIADTRFLSTPEAAAYLGLAPKTLSRWRWAKRGVRYRRHGGRVVYDRAALEAWSASQERGEPADRGDLAAELVAALRRIVSLAKDEIARTVDLQGTVTEAHRHLSAIIDIAELVLARGAP